MDHQRTVVDDLDEDGLCVHDVVVERLQHKQVIFRYQVRAVARQMAQQHPPTDQEAGERGGRHEERRGDVARTVVITVRHCCRLRLKENNFK